MMKAYPQASMNYKQDDQSKLLLIAEFIYNKVKNTSTGHTSFELNYDYYLGAFYKEIADPRSQSKFADEIATELQELNGVQRKFLRCSRAPKAISIMVK